MPEPGSTSRVVLINNAGYSQSGAVAEAIVRAISTAGPLHGHAIGEAVDLGPKAPA